MQHFELLKTLLGEEYGRIGRRQYRSWSQELLERPELAQASELHRKQQFSTT